MVGGGVGVTRRDDVVGILVVALLFGGPSRIVVFSGLRLRLVVLIGVLVEGGLVVAVGGGLAGARQRGGAERKKEAVESLQRLAVVVTTVVRHCNSY